MASKFSHPWLAVNALLVAATMWGLLWYPMRLLEQAGLPGLWATLVAFGVASVAGLVYGFRHLIEFRRHPVALLGLAAAAGWCNVAFILAIIDGNVVRVVLLFYLSPLWTVLLGRMFLGECIDRASASVLAVAMSGALLMLWNPGIGVPWPQDAADWMALSAGLAFSINNVIVRGTGHVALAAKTTASWVGGALLAAVWLLATASAGPDAPAQAWWGAVAVGLFGIVVMTVTVQYGVTHMPVRRSAIILLFELVVATVSAQLLANETLTLREWFGGALIVIAGIIAARWKEDSA